MNSSIEAMLARYHIESIADKKNAMKEAIQEIALSALSHAGFFEKAAFYSGTCLRIFHGLNRFSEDLDFALLQKDPTFRLEGYFPALEREFKSFGIDMTIEPRIKDANSDVQSAFLKGNTLMLLMTFFPQGGGTQGVIPNQKIKIKFEVDTDNPEGGNTETKYRLLPSPYEVLLFDEATLFAGKIHAILCRDYKHHVKGRDYYDYLFYVGKGSRFNLVYLENKLRNTGGILDEGEVLTLERVKKMLEQKFSTVDYESAKEDVARFVRDSDSLKLWKKELFLSTLDELKAD